MIETTTKTHLAHGIEKTEYLVQYDDSVKELLSDKQVLAWIAKYRIEEFKDYDIPTIMECIEGEPEVSSVSVHPGKKSKSVEGGKYDYLSISFIRLPHGNKEESKHKLIDMLATLFSQKMDANTKKELLQEKHQMVMMRDLEGGIHTMCNVGEGVWERAEAAGELKGVSAMVKSLRKFGATDQQIIAQMMEELGLTEAEAKDYFDKVN